MVGRWVVNFLVFFIIIGLEGREERVIVVFVRIIVTDFRKFIMREYRI